MTCNRGTNTTQKADARGTNATSRTAADGGASPVNGQHHVNGTSFASEADSSDGESAAPAINGGHTVGSLPGSTSNASTQTGDASESAVAAPTATTGGHSGIAARDSPLFGQTGLPIPVGSTAGTTHGSSPGLGHDEPPSDEEDDENQENIVPPGNPGPHLQATLTRATEGGPSPGGPRDPSGGGGDDSGAETDH